MLRADKLEEFSSVKINGYHLSSRKVLSRPRQKGSILIGLIVTMVIMASLGAGMFYLTTTSTFQELFANNHARAYYAAESGGRYAKAEIRRAYAQTTTALRDAILATIPGTYNINNGGSFVISSPLTPTGNPQNIAFTSTGIVNSGFLQAKRQINYSITPTNPNLLGSSPHDFTGSLLTGTGSSPWVGTISSDSMVSHATVEGSTIFGSPNEQRAFAYYNLNFSTVYKTTQAALLSYDAQIKISSTVPHFVAGLSFRTQPASLTSAPNDLGVSFMRAPTSWVDNNTSINEGIALELLMRDWPKPGHATYSGDSVPPVSSGDLSPDAYYILLWRDTGASLEELLAYKRIYAASGVLAADGFTTDWATLLVRLEETVLASSTSGSRFRPSDRINKIMVYYSTINSNGTGNHPGGAIDDNRTGSNPLLTTNRWPAAAGASDPNFTLVQWDWVRAEGTSGSGGLKTEPVPYSTVTNCTSGSGCTATEVWTTYNLSNTAAWWGGSHNEFALNVFGPDSGTGAVTNNVSFADFRVRIATGTGVVDGSGDEYQY